MSDNTLLWAHRVRRVCKPRKQVLVMLAGFRATALEFFGPHPASQGSAGGPAVVCELRLDAAERRYWYRLRLDRAVPNAHGSRGATGRIKPRPKPRAPTVSYQTCLKAAVTCLPYPEGAPRGATHLHNVSSADRPPSCVRSGAKLGGTPSGMSDG